MYRFKILLIAGLVSLFIAANLSAIETDTEYYFQSGTMTPDNFKFSNFWAITGFNMHWQLGSSIVVSPEIYLVVQDLKLRNLQIAPALLANIKLGNYYIGLGPTKWFKWGSNAVNSDWMLKINAGLVKYRMIYTLFAVVDFDNDAYNSMIGFKLGLNL